MNNIGTDAAGFTHEFGSGAGLVCCLEICCQLRIQTSSVGNVRRESAEGKNDAVFSFDFDRFAGTFFTKLVAFQCGNTDDSTVFILIEADDFHSCKDRNAEFFELFHERNQDALASSFFSNQAAAGGVSAFTGQVSAPNNALFLGLLKCRSSKLGHDFNVFRIAKTQTDSLHICCKLGR